MVDRRRGSALGFKLTHYRPAERTPLAAANIGSIYRLEGSRPAPGKNLPPGSTLKCTLCGTRVRPGQPHVGGQGGPAAASVFISYSRLDQAVCDQIVRELKERGHAVWLDREAIHGGDGSSARRAITRFVAAFSETLKSYIAWLDSQK